MKRREWLNKFAKGGFLAGLAGMVGVKASAGSPLPEERLRLITERISSIEDVASRDYDYDPYFHGLANGIILAKSIVTDQDPKFIEAPSEWRSEHQPPRTPAGALEVLSREMKSDQEFARAWHSTVMLAAFDEGLDSQASHRAAVRFMRTAFGVDTSDQG